MESRWAEGAGALRPQRRADAFGEQEIASQAKFCLEIFPGYAAFASFLGQLVQLLGLCGIKFHLLYWSILDGYLHLKG